ncbi:hypothetical protein [Ilumatobacter nonamiensis]|uniref:hypothetical protein n=1 Tax=Ilumatobacter nonamiensis TaxID=467093 RepID=UPI0011D248AD|nr:hypothetical protein [Ilumatobacter nonamiensis]
MALDVVTNDASALEDTDLDELASMDDAFTAGQLSKAQEDWVLITTARFGNALHGFTFSTLERIGGTPCVLIGLMSVKRSSKRDQVLRGLMNEAYHRALMAFPDEDVVVGSRFINADAREAFKDLDGLTPSPGEDAVGEERAWGRRLAKRFAIDKTYDAKTFTSASGAQDGYLDFETSSPEKLDDELVDMMSKIPAKKGGAMVVYGWTMAEDLVKLGKR